MTTPTTNVDHWKAACRAYLLGGWLTDEHADEISSILFVAMEDGELSEQFAAQMAQGVKNMEWYDEISPIVDRMWGKDGPA